MSAGGAGTSPSLLFDRAPEVVHVRLAAGVETSCDRIGGGLASWKAWRSSHRSVHARATIWAPFAVIQASSACSVNSATKFFGMSAFRLSTISSAAARFSGDAGASLFVSVMGSNSVGYARRATGLDAPSTLLLANVLDCLLGKGGLM